MSASRVNDRHLTRLKTLDRVAILVMLGLLSSPVLAGNIEGLGGYDLGEQFEPGANMVSRPIDGGGVQYRVEPRVAEGPLEYLWLRLTPDRRIHRITALSQGATAADCAARMSSLRKRIEGQNPSWGYYAMDQAEMFYQDDRTYTLECVETEGGIRLRQEVSDDALAAQGR